MCDVLMFSIEFNIYTFPTLILKSVLSFQGSNSGHRSNNRIQYREIQDIQVMDPLIFSFLTVVINIQYLDLHHSFNVM